jgi:hypothetical protein
VQVVQSELWAARLRGIRAGRASGAPGRSSHNPLAVGSSPTRPTCGSTRDPVLIVDVSWPVADLRSIGAVTSGTSSGHIEQLPSGPWRAKVYAGKDPLTEREIRFRKTYKTECDAQVELRKLQALARAGRRPDSDSTGAGSSRSVRLRSWRSPETGILMSIAGTVISGPRCASYRLATMSALATRVSRDDGP